MEQNQIIKYQYWKIHNEREIKWIKHTLTGCSPFDNKVYFQKNLKDNRISGWHSTYSRIHWDKPAPTIIMSNGSLNTQSPWEIIKRWYYWDAKALTISELLRLTG